MSGNTILRVDSSITGESSVSRQITSRIVEQQLAARVDAQVIQRDLVAEPLPHLTLDQFGEQGVLVVEPVSTTPAPATADLKAVRQQLAQQRSQAQDGKIYEAIKAHANVKDNRTKFF